MPPEHNVFQEFPGRATFKRVGRAFMFGLQAVAPGYGIRDLSKGKSIIQTEIDKQLKREPKADADVSNAEPSYHTPLCTLRMPDKLTR